MKRIFVLLALLAATQAQAIDQSAKDGVIKRCKADMGEYGAAMVKSCVDMDLEAWSNIQALKAGHADLINRCENDMGEYGFAMIESCVKMDIEASEALSKY